MSSFWERVDEELKFIGMTRKALATEVDFNLANIGKGIKLNSCPSAETAIKISKVLNVSVEYLVCGTESDKSYLEQTESEQIRLYKKYKDVINFLESESSEKQNLFKKLAIDLSKLN